MKNNSYNSTHQKSYFNAIHFLKKEIVLPEIVIITSYPPRECGIATYSQDLFFALQNKFTNSFDVTICALESKLDTYKYSEEVKYVLKSDSSASYQSFAEECNQSDTISMVVFQHEFGLFKTNESDFIELLERINKPKMVVLHTVLPNPDVTLLSMMQQINRYATALIVMTQTSLKILVQDYAIDIQKITVIPHGTHLVEFTSKSLLKEKYQIANRKVISTFGLLSSGKCIETSINALQPIVKKHPEVLFLVIGKTHPSVVKNEGEVYRNELEARIKELHLEKYVQFVNKYLPLPELLEYLQLTDIYLFTSKDRNQAVSGTFSYAISCGCPIISTPIPHALEVLNDKTGIIIDFENADQLSNQVNNLLDDDCLRATISSNGIHKLAPTAWENSAISHAILFEQINNRVIDLHYKIPKINLNHIKNLTTDFAMIQFSVINQPDHNSGYTLDDNSRALVALCQHYQLTKDKNDLVYINKYYHFISFCLQPEGYFYNYVDIQKKFTNQNSENLADSNGRAIWAIGYLLSIQSILPNELVENATKTMELALVNVCKIHSPRAMAFIIKGIYYSQLENPTLDAELIVKHLADKLVQMYEHEKDENWYWFESYLTYGNSILPEAILCAFLVTNDENYKLIAKTAFDFLLSKIYKKNRIKVISNKGWLHNTNQIVEEQIGGEQPIDVAYTILALSKFYDVFHQKEYLNKMEIAFDWFLGNNHLHQIIYNPCTGGCYDGLEDTYINLNQGAESTVSYLMARLTIEKYYTNKTTFFSKNKKTYSLKNQSVLT